MAKTALVPNQQNNINVIPGFENTTFSGIPIKGFIKGPWRKVRAALGNISQDDSTMLDVLDQKAQEQGLAPQVVQEPLHKLLNMRHAIDACMASFVS